MRQHDPIKRKLGANTFYIRPFSAFKAANLSGEILSLLTPVFAGMAPLLADTEIDENNITLLDVDTEKAAPRLAKAMSGISGDKLEALLRKMLIQYRNISVEIKNEDGSMDDVQLLTADLADECFCGDTQDIFALAFDVIKVNYSGFFKKLGGRFGGVINALLAKDTPSSTDTEN